MNKVAQIPGPVQKLNPLSAEADYQAARRDTFEGLRRVHLSAGHLTFLMRSRGNPAYPAPVLEALARLEAELRHAGELTRRESHLLDVFIGNLPVPEPLAAVHPAALEPEYLAAGAGESRR